MGPPANNDSCPNLRAWTLWSLALRFFLCAWVVERFSGLGRLKFLGLGSLKLFRVVNLLGLGSFRSLDFCFSRGDHSHHKPPALRFRRWRSASSPFSGTSESNWNKRV